MQKASEMEDESPRNNLSSKNSISKVGQLPANFNSKKSNLANNRVGKFSNAEANGYIQNSNGAIKTLKSGENLKDRNVSQNQKN